jgi:hypothetical protein
VCPFLLLSSVDIRSLLLQLFNVDSHWWLYRELPGLLPWTWAASLVPLVLRLPIHELSICQVLWLSNVQTSMLGYSASNCVNLINPCHNYTCIDLYLYSTGYVSLETLLQLWITNYSRIICWKVYPFSTDFFYNFGKNELSLLWTELYLFQIHMDCFWR